MNAQKQTNEDFIKEQSETSHSGNNKDSQRE